MSPRALGKPDVAELGAREEAKPSREGEQGRRQMLEVADADLELGFVHPQTCRIARRACRRERSGVPGFTMAAWVASHAPECTELTVERDRGFESASLQQGVSYEPDFLRFRGRLEKMLPSTRGQRVRIRLPPAASLVRT